MSKLRAESFTVSIDGYGAGPNQSLENPLGVGGVSLHQWALATRLKPFEINLSCRLR
jgi:hypothetical protein